MSTNFPSAKVALVTGASSGIGEASTQKLLGLGYTVYGAARRVDRMQHLAAQGARLLALDVTDDASLQAAVETIIRESGRIDVLVNNAGYGSYGAVEDVPTEEARAQFEVNVFGASRLTQLVLPHMRAQKSGTIINVSSMGGRMWTPMGAWYHATKYAIEAFSDCLRFEVKPFGIDVVVVEPGSIKTEWGRIAAENLRKTSGQSAYGEQAEKVAAQLASDTGGLRASDPSVIADVIGKAVTAKRPKTRYIAGAGARPLILMKQALPDRAYDAIIRRAM